MNTDKILDEEYWNSWDKELWEEIAILHRSRNMFQRIVEVIRANPVINVHNDLLDWLCANYVWATIMSLRRLTENVDKSRSKYDTLSLHRLVSSMCRSHEEITKDYFMTRQGGPSPKATEEEFDSLLKPNDYLPRQVLETELQKLDDVRTLVETTADKYLAHHDRDRLHTQVTFEELYDAINRIEEVYHFTHWLLGGPRQCVLPEVESMWEQIFHTPWIPQKANS
jgi:hypothetical protein